jgi:hypothetical protein
MREIWASTSIRNPNAKSGNLKSLLRSRANGHLQILLFAVAPRKALAQASPQVQGDEPAGRAARPQSERGRGSTPGPNGVCS